MDGEYHISDEIPSAFDLIGRPQEEETKWLEEAFKAIGKRIRDGKELLLEYKPIMWKTDDSAMWIKHRKTIIDFLVSKGYEASEKSHSGYDKYLEIRLG